MAARIRVFVLTFRRPVLLRRALNSLLAQTFTEWTCELHNDAPDDTSPRQVLQELAPNDPRFTYVAHATNWGPVASFNHVFKGGPEPLACLLEDDNWWEPTFLETVVTAITAEADAAIAWTNMRIWEEAADGRWSDTGRTVWQITTQQPVVFRTPEILQAFDALHSNGAMIFRPDAFRVRTVPTGTPFAIIEQLRERAARGPLIFVPAVHANFAVTRQTARSDDPAGWAQAKLLVATSFMRAHPPSQEALSAIWRRRRALRPPDTDIFFQIAGILRQPRLIRFAGVREWFHFLLGAGRHPLRLWRALQFRRHYADVWAWLCEQTQAKEAAIGTTVLSKQDLISCRES